jgi:hypothetical protein
MLYFRGRAETRKCATRTAENMSGPRSYLRHRVSCQVRERRLRGVAEAGSDVSSRLTGTREELEEIISFRLARRMAHTPESA